MKSPALFLLTAAASFGFAADGGGTPPVLRPLEPADSVVFRLPGPSPAVPRTEVPNTATAPKPEPPIHKVVAAPPQPKASPLPKKLVTASIPRLPVVPRRAAPAPAPMPASVVPAKAPAVEAANPALPPEAAKEVAFYCQKEIGRWSEGDARKLLGAPLRNRAAYDERKRPDGRIYAFRDPTSRYRELELDFDGKTGTLRSVYVYPQRMTWQDVRRRWRGEVSAAEAPQGRKFYSYTNRHLDVLVDGEGKVISLGLY
ncbi:MAG: hypothetical protein JST11_01150 [Acidobacteria bacterium]|nr:hypothetical protein [Acidobacteriota bacterium]